MSGLPVRPPGGSNPGREKVGVGVAANFRPGRGLMWLQGQKLMARDQAGARWRRTMHAMLRGVFSRDFIWEPKGSLGWGMNRPH